MPEGPEVETIRVGLLSLVGKKIVDVCVANHPKYVPLRENILSLKGSTIMDIQRKGKFLVWYCKNTDELAILNHLGMTGVWYYYSDEKWSEFNSPFDNFKHWKVYFRMEDNSHILFVNVRTFGKLEVMTPEEIRIYPAIAKLGPDILDSDFNTNEFISRLKGKYRPRIQEIGKLLLDYSIVAGCGNIYKSEALFRAKINPFTPVNEISKSKLRTLAGKLTEVGQEAFKFKGSTLRDFRHINGYSGMMQNNFQVYDRAGKECNECGVDIEIGKQGGRSSFWCPSCQPM